MALDIDGIAVLRAIAENPTAFPDLGTELRKVARKLVVKQLKAKTTNLPRLRAIHSVIGGDALALILDDLGASGSAALVKKLDKNNMDLPVAPKDCHKRITLLASGAVEPVAKAPKPAAAPKVRKQTTAPQSSGAPDDIKILTAALVAAPTDLASGRELWRKAGEATFARVLDTLTVQRLRALAKKLDSQNTSLAKGSDELLRTRITDLVSGRAEPMVRSVMDVRSMATVGRRKLD